MDEEGGKGPPPAAAKLRCSRRTDQVALGGAEGQGDKQTGSRGGQVSLRRRKRAALCPKLDGEDSGARTEWQTDRGRSCGFPR